MGKTSKVWIHFAITTDASAPVCNICKESVKIKDGSTTNMRNHLNRKHNIQVECRPAKRQQSPSPSDNESETHSGHKKAKQVSLGNFFGKLTKSKEELITKAIANHIVQDLRPLDSVNDTGFVQLVKLLEPRYTMKSRTHITEEVLPAMYLEVRKEVQQKLNAADYVALTTDGWTSRTSKSFITITAQVITEKYQLEEFVLSTKECLESHTGENLANDFQKSIEEWGLKTTEVSVTTDNAANIVLAMNKANVMTHIRCMAHTLNLATQKGLEPISRLLGRVRRVVQYFHRSTVASNILRKTQEQLEMPKLSLIMDVTTRWNSTYDMIERYIALQPAIYASLAHPDLKNAKEKDTLSNSDIKDMEDIKEVSIKKLTSLLYLNLKCKQKY